MNYLFLIETLLQFLIVIYYYKIMPLNKRVDYIEHKIRSFERYNPVIFHRQIRRIIYDLYAQQINSFSDNRLDQIGGSRKEAEFIQAYKGYKFRINVEKTKYDTTINILTHSKDTPLHCAIINVDAKTKVAYIGNISYHRGCTVPTLVKSGGNTILNFILGFLRTNKKNFGINRLALRDNSIKACNKCPESVELGSMYFLLHGNTWYGKYGFRPYDISKMKPDKYNMRLYEKNQKIMAKAKVKDVKLIRHIEQAIKKYKITDVDVEIIKKGLQKWENKSLSQVLRALMKDYDKYCCIFTYIQPKLFRELGLYRFHGLDFYLDI